MCDYIALWIYLLIRHYLSYPEAGNCRLGLPEGTLSSWLRTLILFVALRASHLPLACQDVLGDLNTKLGQIHDRFEWCSLGQDEKEG